MKRRQIGRIAAAYSLGRADALAGRTRKTAATLRLLMGCARRESTPYAMGYRDETARMRRAGKLAQGDLELVAS